MIKPLDLGINNNFSYDSQPSSLESKVNKKPSVWEKVFRKRKLEKPRTIAILYLHDNNRVEPMELEPKNGFFNINGKTYHERKDCIWTMTYGRDKIPLAIIPEKNLTPVGTGDWEEKTTQEKFAELQDHVIKGIRHAEMVKLAGDGDSKKLNKTVILIIIAVIIGIALLSGYIPGLG